MADHSPHPGRQAAARSIASGDFASIVKCQAMVGSSTTGVACRPNTVGHDRNRRPAVGSLLDKPWGRFHLPGAARADLPSMDPERRDLSASTTR